MVSPLSDEERLRLGKVVAQTMLTWLEEHESTIDFAALTKNPMAALVTLTPIIQEVSVLIADAVYNEINYSLPVLDVHIPEYVDAQLDTRLDDDREVWFE